MRTGTGARASWRQAGASPVEPRAVVRHLPAPGARAFWRRHARYGRGVRRLRSNGSLGFRSRLAFRVVRDGVPQRDRGRRARRGRAARDARRLPRARHAADVAACASTRRAPAGTAASATSWWRTCSGTAQRRRPRTPSRRPSVRVEVGVERDRRGAEDERAAGGAAWPGRLRRRAPRASLARSRGPRFSVAGTVRRSAISATHGTPRRAKSVTTIERSVHSFRCVPCRRGVEHEPSLAREPAAELDVLDRRARVALGVEPADRARRRRVRTAPRPAQKVPAVAGRALVHRVVQQVAEPGHDPVGDDEVVVRAEHGHQAGVGGERRTDPRERIRVHEHVGVDEHDDVPRRPVGAGVPRRGGAGAGRRS